MRYIDFGMIITAIILAGFIWNFLGIPNEYYEAFVRYQTEDGRTVNASLANSDCFLNIGDWVKIKYIPGNEDYPVLTG